jgi:hypothetical protein
LDDPIRFSAAGIPQWFSPKHAGEKFRDLALGLAKAAMDLERRRKVSAKRLWELEELAEKYARYYLVSCPVSSVRIMEPSGAIYVMLPDGTEVLVPRPTTRKRRAGSGRQRDRDEN